MKADGSLGELLYSFDGFDQPDFRQYSDKPIVLHPGEGIEWRCAYYNYIPSITREHCLLLEPTTRRRLRRKRFIASTTRPGGDVVTHALVP